MVLILGVCPYRENEEVPEPKRCGWHILTSFSKLDPHGKTQTAGTYRWERGTLPPCLWVGWGGAVTILRCSVSWRKSKRGTAVSIEQPTPNLFALLLWFHCSCHYMSRVVSQAALRSSSHTCSRRVTVIRCQWPSWYVTPSLGRGCCPQVVAAPYGMI